MSKLLRPRLGSMGPTSRLKNQSFSTGRRDPNADPTGAAQAPLLSEQDLLQRLIELEEVDKRGQMQLTKAKSERVQLQRSIEDLKHVIKDLQYRIQEAGSNSGSVRRELLLQEAEMTRTLVDNDIRQLEETLRIMTERIKSLVARRDKREEEASNLTRRIASVQRSVINPKSSTPLQAAVDECKQLAAKVKAMSLQACELRALTTSKSLQLPKNTQEREEATAVLELQLSRAQRENNLVTLSSVAATTDQVKRFRDDHEAYINQLITQHESNKILAAKLARNEEERELMQSKQLLTRALSDDQPVADKVVKGGRQVAAWGKAGSSSEADVAEQERKAKIAAEKRLQDSMNKNRLFVQQLTDERMRLSRFAKSVAAVVENNNVLMEEHAALQSVVSQLARDISSTNDVLEKMSSQLDSVRTQQEAESRNKDLWICADAEKLDQTLVSTILAKEDELRTLQAKISEMQTISKQLGTPSLVGLASQQQRFTAGGNAYEQRSSSGAGSPSSPFYQNNSGVAAGAASTSQLKRSMMMDL